jgi:hypothetical protein
VANPTATRFARGYCVTSFCTGQPGQRTYSARALDFYSSPAIATEALLTAEHFAPDARFWECAAGDGGIARVLRDRGFPVICSDVVRRTFPLHFVADFFTLTPPFRNATEFAEHAIDLVPDVYLLLRLAFYESVRRTELLEHRSSRCPCFPTPFAANVALRRTVNSVQPNKGGK